MSPRRRQPPPFTVVKLRDDEQSPVAAPCAIAGCCQYDAARAEGLESGYGVTEKLLAEARAEGREQGDFGLIAELRQSVADLRAQLAASERFRKEDGFSHINEAAEYARTLQDLRAQLAEAQQERDACAVYLKEGETPTECIARNRADVDGVMGLLVKEKHRAEQAEAALATAREHAAQAATDAGKVDAQIINDFMRAARQQTIERVKAAAFSPTADGLSLIVEIAKLDALAAESGPSDTVTVTRADAEKAIQLLKNSGAWWTGPNWNAARQAEAEARRLLGLPQEDK
jgi:hypothetical protein